MSNEHSRDLQDNVSSEDYRLNIMLQTLVEVERQLNVNIDNANNSKSKVFLSVNPLDHLRLQGYVEGLRAAVAIVGHYRFHQMQGHEHNHEALDQNLKPIENISPSQSLRR